ncbi:conserved hypothetical protein [Synechococcus sp. PCC 7335]|uniref:YdcF family protein n=1 Tax=Synechococcus sp. (strain ATCC 29403 / PCC 7335) TaxID=91464 RepID=UPI00017ED551|nr:ElyC/SanA/YdcF family protein [Synechococcus sp. PCC 7335]EDX86492.1 conserved hypothetical protein [Synechococcus sp. PCC 7335]
MLLVLLTQILVFAAIALVVRYVFTKASSQKYLVWFVGVLLFTLLATSFTLSDNGTIEGLWELFSFPLTPLGASLILIGISLGKGGSMRPQAGALALAILLFSSTPLSAGLLVNRSEQSTRAADILGTRNLATAVAIVVFGDRNDINRAISPTSDMAASYAPAYTALAPRITYAADLYAEARRRGAAPMVMVTAGSVAEDTNQRAIIREMLADNGIASRDILIRSTGLDVRGTAEAVEGFLESQRLIARREQRLEPDAIRDVPWVVLVAPAIIMSRAELTFEQIGLRTIPRPTSFSTLSVDTDGPSDQIANMLLNLIPSVDTLRLTSEYWDERLTYLYYFARGWLPNLNFSWDSNAEP